MVRVHWLVLRSRTRPKSPGTLPLTRRAFLYTMTVSQLTTGGVMPRTKTDSRARLIEAAVKVTYQHGFETTALADIAEEARVPLGNVYYYFKTKDEIGEAI